MRSRSSFERLEAAYVADHAAIDRGVPIAFDAHQAVVAGEHIDAAANAAADADRLVVFNIASLAPVSAKAVDQRAGGANLDAGAAGDAGAFAQRNAQVGHQEGAVRRVLRSRG